MSSLYLTHFGLVSPPFSITPDPRFFFEGKDRGVFIGGLLHATLQAEGIVVVIGEVGSGKTLMSRILLTRLPKHVDTVYLPNPAFSRNEIIEVIARELGVEEAAPGHVLRLKALEQELIKRREQGRHVVVLIDEAHAMSTDSIDEIRQLSNLETDNYKLVQVVLCGQPELDTLLEAPHLRQLRDRVVYRLVLRSLSKEDSGAYLNHRLRVAGWRGSRMFSWCAERLLLNDAKGRARRLNILADKALLAAYADNQKLVTAKHVLRAIRDAGANFATPGNGRRWPWGLMAAWAATIAVAVASSLWFSYTVAPNHGATVAPGLPAVSAVKPSPQQPLPSELPLPSTPKTAPAATAPAPVATKPTPVATAPAPAAAMPAPVATAPAPAATAPAPAATAPAPVNEITGQPSALAPQGQAKPGDLAPGPLQPENIGERLKQSQAYALEQSVIGHYAIRLTTLQFEERVPAFLANLETILPPEQIYVRRFLTSEADGTQQAMYVIYFGSYPTHEAARQAIAELPRVLNKDKPTIRTWKEISDAPWSPL